MIAFDIYIQQKDAYCRLIDGGMARHRALIEARQRIRAQKPNMFQKDPWYTELTAEWENVKTSIRNAYDEMYSLEDEFYS
jgi:hypothetical protein